MVFLYIYIGIAAESFFTSNYIGISHCVLRQATLEEGLLGQNVAILIEVCYWSKTNQFVIEKILLKSQQGPSRTEKSSHVVN